MDEVLSATYSSYSSSSADIDIVRHEVELSQSKADNTDGDLCCYTFG
tara:strand:+ start:832 stop:972 length:141 start_codon:yes stop_codon:yes gene_type:complete